MHCVLPYDSAAVERHLTTNPGPVRWKTAAGGWTGAFRLALALVSMLGALVGIAVATPAAAADPVALPAGKANYTVVVMSDRFKSAWVRLAQYTFSTDGTINQSFWFWHNHTFTGSGHANKIPTGYTTSGCARVCTVRTPIGFQPGAAPKRLTGTFRWDVNNNLVIDWSAGSREAWRVTPLGSYARLDIITSNYGVTQGSWGFGSNAAFTAGATIDQIKSAGSLSGATRRNLYGSSVVNDAFRIPISQFNRCGASPCIMGKAPQSWITYLANKPDQDGRKVFWDHELAEVADPSPCTADPHGHTMALLQVIDDNGLYRGFVGVEASLHQRLHGGAIVAALFALRQD